MIFKVG